MLLSTAHAGRARPSVWRAADVADAGTLDDTSSTDDRACTSSVARSLHAAAARADAATLTRDDFPLPTLAGAIGEWSPPLRAGRGLRAAPRFPIDELLAEPRSSSPTSALGSHLGTPVSQDADGTAARPRPRRAASTRTGPEVRLYRPRERQDFHTDGADIIGLLCLHSARVRRREPDRERYAGLQRDPPPPTRPARRALRADVLGPQRRGVARRGAVLPAAGPPRRRRRARGSSTSAGTSATRNATRACRGSPTTSARRST